MVMNKQAAEYAQKLAYYRGAMLAAAEFEKQAGIMDSPIVQQLRAAASNNRNALIGAGVGAGLGAGVGAAAGGEDHRGSGAALGALGGAALGAGAGHGITAAGGMSGLADKARSAAGAANQKARSAAGAANQKAQGVAGGLAHRLRSALGMHPDMGPLGNAPVGAGAMSGTIGGGAGLGALGGLNTMGALHAGHASAPTGMGMGMGVGDFLDPRDLLGG